MSFKRDLRQLMKPHYIINIFLSLSFLMAKRLPYICNYLFNQVECELDGRETQILFFLITVIMIRTRKTGSVTMISYMSSSFVYAKVANLVLWFYADIRFGILYAIIYILCALMLPEPTYDGPENVIYLRGSSSLEEELNKDKKVVWLIAFYTVWSPSSVNFAPIFSELSANYALDNLKFGKLDVGRHPDVAAKYRINDSSKSKQLPTLILFKQGKEVDRRPYIDRNNKLVHFVFSIDNIEEAFLLKDLHKSCKENPTKRKDKKAIKAD